MNERYKAVEGSETAHCCFKATVVDTMAPIQDDSAWMCECFDMEIAQNIADALNAGQASRAASDVLVDALKAEIAELKQTSLFAAGYRFGRDANDAGHTVRLQKEKDALQAKCEKLKSELDSHKAARIAYASEFPLDGDGNPDVGSIHQNIRTLKAEYDALRAKTGMSLGIGDGTGRKMSGIT